MMEYLALLAYLLSPALSWLCVGDVHLGCKCTRVFTYRGVLYVKQVDVEKHVQDGPANGEVW